MASIPSNAKLQRSTLLKQALDALGELFIMGFSGLELSKESEAFITEAKVGGVLLFSANYENPAQLSELSNQIQASRSAAPLWIAADYEGGRVQRFKQGFTRIPDAASIAAANSPKLTFEIAKVMATELKAVGVNLNFAPVVDILTHPKNQVIGNRAFGNRADVVCKMASAMIRGHLRTGIQPCVKHFPGHGGTSTDSHYALPRLDTPLDLFKAREFKPYLRAFRSGCSMVMTAHIVANQLDADLPATLSQKILYGILRKGLGFSGLVVSDDLEMKAITDHYGFEEAPRLAILAGCDLLIYRSEASARNAYDALRKALERKQLPPERVLESASRARALKSKAQLQSTPIVISEVGKWVGCETHATIIEKITRASSAN